MLQALTEAILEKKEVEAHSYHVAYSHTSTT
jgi:hypothetical protein